MPTAQYSNEGVRITVNDMIKDPLLIPRRFLKLSDYEYIMESLLRKVPPATSGVIRYELEPPLFANDDPAEVAEGAEIPLTQAEVGEPRAAYTIKHGSGIEITKEMKSRNRVDLVNRRMEMVKNTFVRLYETRLFDAVNAASIPQYAVGNEWNVSTDIRADIITAQQIVAEARTPAAPGEPDGSPLGFQADTLVLSRTNAYDLLRSEDFSKHYQGNVADENIQFTGKLPQKILGLNVLVSRFLPAGDAYVMQRNEVGGYSDEWPLTTDPMEYDKRRQVWYSIVSRRTGIFIDNPKACVKLTGLGTTVPGASDTDDV